MTDERIEQVKNKIRSEMAIILFIGVVISFLVKTWVYNMDLKECITEYIIIIFFPLYQFIRMHMMKISIYSERGNKQSVKNLIITIALLVIVSALIIFNSITKSGVYHWQTAATNIFSFLVIFAIVFFVANKYNRHRGHKYENEFDDDK